MHRDLVIVRAGPQSRHAEWVQGGTPSFDLFILPYQEISQELLSVGTLSELIPGSKVQGWSVFFSRYGDVLDRYERIALLDDDLSCSAADINRAFAMGAQHDLKLWQPSLTPNSYFTYALFQCNPLFTLRYVNFIEMMCPFMTAQTAKGLLPLFATGYETGIDRFWCRLIGDPYKACAVLDEVRFHHTRSVGRDRAMQGFVGEEGDYQTVIEKMEALSGLPYAGSVAYAGVTRAGKEIRNRTWMAALSVAPLIWAFRNPTGKYLKRFMIGLKHNLLSTVDFDQMEMDGLISRIGSRAE